MPAYHMWTHTLSQAPGWEGLCQKLQTLVTFTVEEESALGGLPAVAQCHRPRHRILYIV